MRCAYALALGRFLHRNTQSDITSLFGNRSKSTSKEGLPALAPGVQLCAPLNPGYQSRSCHGASKVTIWVLGVLHIGPLQS